MNHSVSYEKAVSLLFRTFNHVRNDPQSLVPELERRLKLFVKDKIYCPVEGAQIYYETAEGPTAVRELIAFLNTKFSVKKLEWSPKVHQLADAVACLVASRRQYIFSEVTKRYLTEPGLLCCQISMGSIDPFDILCDFLIDDGYPKRENRTQFFSASVSHLGIGISTSLEHKFVICLVYTDPPKNDEKVASHQFKNSFSDTKCDCNLI